MVRCAAAAAAVHSVDLSLFPAVTWTTRHFLSAPMLAGAETYDLLWPCGTTVDKYMKQQRVCWVCFLPLFTSIPLFLSLHSLSLHSFSLALLFSYSSQLSLWIWSASALLYSVTADSTHAGVGAYVSTVASELSVSLLRWFRLRSPVWRTMSSLPQLAQQGTALHQCQPAVSRLASGDVWHKDESPDNSQPCRLLA